MALYQLPAVSAADGWETIFPARGDRAALRVRLIPIGASASRHASAALRNADHPIEEYAGDVGFDEFSRELLRRGIVNWEGVGADGEVAPLTRENIDALLTDPDILGRLQGLYVFPFLEREQEKNGSSPSSAGTGRGTTAGKGTARAAGSDAKPVRTRSTRRKAPAAKRAGT